MKSLTRHIVTAVILATLVSPALSEIFCIEGCAGGQSKSDAATVSCDLNTATTCCGTSNTACASREFYLPEVRPGTDCQLCGCFSFETNLTFLTSKSENKSNLERTHSNLAALIGTGHWENSARRFSRIYFVRTHDPPVYYQIHALLL